MRKFVLILVAALSLAFAAGAQTIPVSHKFGSVSDREIDMTVYEADTSAVAVVLYRNYKLDLVFNFKLEVVQNVTVHERIKILKEAGKEYADYSFIYTYSNSLREGYSGVKVETYNREDGKVVRTRMNKKYQFDEKFSDTARRLSFTAENVKVGSVIEVTYQFTSPQFWSIDNIEYQEEIPINEMDIDVGYAEYFRMNRTQRGGVRTVNSQENSQESLHLGGGETVSYQLQRDLYKAVDVPALREESYSFCPEQYRGQVLYDLSGVSIPGSVYRNFNSTWQDVDKAIAESGIVRECKARFRDTEELDASLEGAEEDEARISAVRNWVAGKVKWDKTSRLVPNSAKDVLKKGSGSDADINALTASILNSLGYVAEPVMVRRRGNGILLDFHITMNAFNTFLLRVTDADGSKSWFLDAARDEGGLNILNPQFLVEEARLIHLDGRGEWVDISKLTRGRTGQIVSVRLTEDGTLEGTSKVQALGEDAYALKARYNRFDTEEAYIEDIENDEEIQIESLEFKKGFGPTAELDYTFTKDQSVGEMLYIHPFLGKFHGSGAFRKETRDIPVDFPYPVNISYTFLMDIPEGYAVEELPESQSLSCPPVNGNILFQCKVIGERISLNYRFILDRYLVLPAEYPDLRAFWEAAAGIENCTIVLKKQ